MEKDFGGLVLIECPNTIFHLYVDSEEELSKIEVFMNNMKNLNRVGLNDIYNWCNRQGILYDTKFNFHKDFTFGKTLHSFVHYIKVKLIYQLHLLPA